MSKIIIAIIVFLFLILIHEFGHFIVAKLSDIKVNEFAVGMGPKLFSKKKGETQYSLRLIPIGGYCAMEGEDDESNDPRSFDQAPASKRFLTILAGPVMNLILAFIVFTIVSFFRGVPTTTVGEVVKDSPAYEAGITAGDTITKIEDYEIKSFEDIAKALSENNNKESVSVYVKKDKGEDVKTFNIKPEIKQGTPVIGVISNLRKPNFIEALTSGLVETGNNIKMIFVILAKLFTGAVSVSNLSGPIGVVKEIGNQASNGVMNLFYFLAYISVNLAVFNLLPIPALDGSKLFTSGFEIITGKKVNKKIEEKVTIGGFIVLMGLILLVSIKDIISLF